MSGLIDLCIKTLALYKGATAQDYCQLETRASVDHQCLLTTHGGFISALKIDGVNQHIGAQEAKDLTNLWTELLQTILTSNQTDTVLHEIDWGYTQNPLETNKMLDDHFQPMHATARKIGLESYDLLRAEETNLRRYVRPEHGVIYIKTSPSQEIAKLTMEKIKEANGDLQGLFNDRSEAQSLERLMAYSTDLLDAHEAKVEQVFRRLLDRKYSIARADAHEIPALVKRDVICRQEGEWNAWLMGDPARRRFTPDDPTYNEKNLGDLASWTGPSLAQQVMPYDIEKVEFGIVKMGDLYMAPLLIELLPEKGGFNKLQDSIRMHIPFRYRIRVTPKKTASQSLNENLARITALSKEWMKRNTEIVQSFNHISELLDANVPCGNVSITMATWHHDLNTLKANLAQLKASISAWGNATVLSERGDIQEALIATMPGFCSSLFTPMTLAPCYEIASLLPSMRKSAPFESSGFTPLRTPGGRFWPFNPMAPELVAYIELILAGTGSGKSVYQNCVNRDSNLRVGNSGLARHATIDVGISGKGTVQSMKNDLPSHLQYQVLYEKLSLQTHHAINPFDLQLGASRPTPVDQSFLVNFLKLLTTPDGHDAPPAYMVEMCVEVIDTAYRMAFDPEKAKEYSRGINADVDAALDKYPQSKDNIWGLTQTWVKVADFLFAQGEERAATIAYRYIVPTIPELPAIVKEQPSFRRFKEEQINQFEISISTACRALPNLTQPTRVDFDTARYIVLDLNDVTQEEGSRQTAVMYALASQVCTRDYWLSTEDLPVWRSLYKDWALAKIRDIREQKLGVTFEEFRRTKGIPSIRSMINRWMAEGRKWGVRVQLVMQDASHADPEMFSHATIITLMGTWDRAKLNSLIGNPDDPNSTGYLELTPTEIQVLTNGQVHGPRREGSTMLMRYNLKSSGWGSQLLTLTRSVPSLWMATTTDEDLALKEAMIRELGEDHALIDEILTTVFPSGTAQEEYRKHSKELAKIGDDSNAYDSLVRKAIRSWQLRTGKATA